MEGDKNNLKILEQRIHELESQLAKQKEANNIIRNNLKRGFPRIFRYIIGKRLDVSIRKLFTEIDKKKITSNTLADVTSGVIYRFTRIGFFLIVGALLPVFFLSLQSYLLHIQNKKIDAQNRRLDQQTYLQEGERRSSYVFLLNNAYDQIDYELRENINGDRSLSKSLIARIISLSRVLRPYRYLSGDNLIEFPNSPERSQLLLTLVNSGIKESSLDEIFKDADFSYSDLRGVDLRNRYLKHAFLDNSHFIGTTLTGANLSNTSLVDASFVAVTALNANLDSALIWDSRFIECNFGLSSFRHSFIENCHFVSLLNAEKEGYLNKLIQREEIGYRSVDEYYPIFADESRDSSLLFQTLVNFSGCDFSRTDFTSAVINDNLFQDATFPNSIFQDANVNRNKGLNKQIE